MGSGVGGGKALLSTLSVSFATQPRHGLGRDTSVRSYVLLGMTRFAELLGVASLVYDDCIQMVCRLIRVTYTRGVSLYRT